MLTQLLDAWSRQLVALLLLPAILGVLLHVTERGTQEWLRRALGWKGVIWWTGWLGTPVHELSHAVVSLAFLHRIHEIKLFEPHPEDGVLGYVRYSFPQSGWRWWLGTIGQFFSGVAPLFGGSLVIVGALALLAPGARDVLGESERYAATLASDSASQVVSGFVALVRAVYSGVFTAGDARSWVFLYIALAIGAHMGPSPADLKGGAGGFGLLVLGLLAGDLVMLLAGRDPHAAIGAFGQLAALLSAVLFLALTLNVGNLGFAFVVGLIAGRRRHADA